MRIGIFSCVLLWAGFTTGKLHSAPKVSMSAKLQETLAGRIVQRRLEVYVGKSVDVLVRHQDTNYRYSGKIEQIIVPDIADYLSTGHQARFKAKLSDVQRQEPQDDDMPLPEIVELKRLSIFGTGGVGHLQYISAVELVGYNYRKARLLAEYKDDSGETFWEALVELEDNPEGYPRYPRERETEPFVVLLNEKKDFTEVITY